MHALDQALFIDRLHRSVLYNFNDASTISYRDSGIVELEPNVPRLDASYGCRSDGDQISKGHLDGSKRCADLLAPFVHWKDRDGVLVSIRRNLGIVRWTMAVGLFGVSIFSHNPNALFLVGVGSHSSLRMHTRSKHS